MRLGSLFERTVSMVPINYHCNVVEAKEGIVSHGDRCFGHARDLIERVTFPYPQLSEVW